MVPCSVVYNERIAIVDLDRLLRFLRRFRVNYDAILLSCRCCKLNGIFISRMVGRFTIAHSGYLDRIVLRERFVANLDCVAFLGRNHCTC
ncbi:hypothetical protein D3C71_2007790 [compost metagenome]